MTTCRLGEIKMTKPLLFLAVNGVLNPVCPHPDAEFDAHTILGYRV